MSSDVAGHRTDVLVVDDDPSILELIDDILSGEGYHVAAARNGAEALDRLDAEAPCVVLLDMRMPVLDGWGFVRAARERGRRFPIVVITAAENARGWAQEVGAEGYLAKPFHLSDLLSSVGRFCPHSGGAPSTSARSAYQ